jgi:putative ABC transport system ATP-binding protein
MSSPGERCMIQAEELCKTYSTGLLEVQVLRDVNLTIYGGEFVAVMGPSGSGKSTLLYLMGGLDKPTSGRIFVDGQDLSEMNDLAGSILRRRNVGFVFQFYNLIPNLTVEENILLPLLLDGKKAKAAHGVLEELLDTVEITHRRNHTPSELSGGEQQRVAIARALINEPDIVLADEPTGNLDSRAGENIMKLLRTIHRQKQKTIVMVTHSSAAADYAERTIHVRDGRTWDESAARSST